MGAPSGDPRQGCDECGGGVDELRSAAGQSVCAALACQAALGARRRRAQSTARSERGRLQLGFLGLDPTRTSWSTVPSFQGGPVPLAPQRRAAFITHITAIVTEAGHADPNSPLPARRSRHLTPEESRALGTGCASCRGHCCRPGGTTAFLTPDSIRRVWSRRPTLTPNDTAALYAGFLPSAHLEGSCIFHTEQGCALPRAIRSDSCNRYLCADLDDALRHWRNPEGLHGRHHFVAISLGDSEVARVQMADLPGNGPPGLGRPAS